MGLPKGLLIAYDHPSGRDSVRASGIVFNGGFVLTHGTILVPLIHVPTQKKWLKGLLKSLPSRPEPSDHLDSHIKLRAHLGEVTAAEALRVVGVWKCPLVARSLGTLFHDWTMGDVARGGDATHETDADIDLSKELMSVFLLLRPAGTQQEAAPNLSELLLALSEPLRGQEVVVESTPFGSELFLNSLSRGIVSNVVGSQKCLLLTDARTVSGCEGGPIFAVDCLKADCQEKGKLLGLVSCPLTWWRGEWVGLTIGISLAPVLRRLVRSPVRAFGPPQPNMDNPQSSLVDRLLISRLEVTERGWRPLATQGSPSQLARGRSPPRPVSLAQNMVDETVVLVRCGSSWGSGVVVDARTGVIITCSHVVRNESSEKVRVFYKGSFYPVEVVFRTRDGLAYDVAVLKTQHPSQVFAEQMEMAEDPPVKGEAVVAAGYPLVSEREDPSLKPTLVQGCVARSNGHMVQTTCCVQSGASGGAIVRDGRLLGLVVCNAKDSSTGALFPHVNFGIPLSAIRKPLLEFIETGNVLPLKSLESTDPEVQSLWKLYPQKSKL